MASGLLHVETDPRDELPREGDEPEVTDPKSADLGVERRAVGRVAAGEMGFEKLEIDVETGDPLHRVDVVSVGRDLGCEEPIVFGCLISAVGGEAALVERPLPRPPWVAREDGLGDKAGEKLLEGDVGRGEPGDERRTFRFEAIDPPFVVGAARELHELARDQERRFGRCLDPRKPREHRAAEHAAERLGIGRPVDLLVADGVDVAAAALDEERDRIPSERLLDDPRGDGRKIGRRATARRIHDRMTGEEVDDRERRAVEAIELEKPHLGVDRGDGGDRVIGRH